MVPNRSVKKISFLLFFLFILFGACKRDELPNDAKLLNALNLAGDNKSELEKVLSHYSSKEDSLKYKAAVFLIKYMPGKYARVCSEYDNYKPIFDTLESLNSAYEKTYKKNNAEFYKFYKTTVFNYFVTKHHIKTTGLNFVIKEDIKTITADYLIENIDYAFKAWQMPWNKTLSFADFCEYILPYRYGFEELQPWRKTYYEYNVHLLDSFKNENDPVKVCMFLKGLHEVTRSELTNLGEISGSIKPLDLIRINTTTSCKDESGVMLLRLRGLGIPITRITFPNWGNWGEGHDVNGVLSADGKWVPFVEEGGATAYVPLAQFRTAKAFAETYSNNVNSTFVNVSDDLYTINPHYIDVTKYVSDVTDITIPYKNSKNGTQVCLCIFNNTDWIPIVSSIVNNGNAIFSQIGKRVIYMTGTISSGELELKGVPFLIDSTGNIKKIQPSKTNKTITLSRKYVPNSGFINSMQNLKGCYFQGSNDSNFTNAVTLWKIDTLTSLHTIEKDIKDAKYQYIRLMFPKITRLNEGFAGMQIYSKTNQGKILLTGEPISSTKASKTFYTRVFDDNLLTFVRLLGRNAADFAQFYDGECLVIPDEQPFWIGLKFNSVLNITSLGLSLRTDDNEVNKGESYELFYWNKEWVSLGQKIAVADKIQFNAPQHALYLLKNVYKGKENRIFLYQDGKQIWY